MPWLACDRASNNLQRIRVVLAVAGIAMLAASVALGQTQIAARNSISGTVRIFDLNGDEIRDRSDIVIFIDGLPDVAQHQGSSKPSQVSHKDRQFSPSVLPIVRGSIVDFFNDDSIYHNVFSLSKAKTFDLGIYPEGTSKLVTFSQPGLVKIHCNIHPKMISTILVLNNNLFATTSADGSYRIEGVPDGTFILRVWSEFSDEQSRTASFIDGRHFEESFEIHETKRYVQHKNKFGKRYREKY